MMTFDILCILRLRAFNVDARCANLVSKQLNLNMAAHLENVE